MDTFYFADISTPLQSVVYLQNYKKQDDQIPTFGGLRWFAPQTSQPVQRLSEQAQEDLFRYSSFTIADVDGDSILDVVATKQQLYLPFGGTFHFSQTVWFKKLDSLNFDTEKLIFQEKEKYLPRDVVTASLTSANKLDVVTCSSDGAKIAAYLNQVFSALCPVHA